jgi:hypothetical protein
MNKDVYIVWLVNFELEQMNDLPFVLSEMLKDYEQKLENVYTGDEIDTLDDDDEEADAEFEKYIDIFQSVLGDFPRRLYSSFIVSWYSFIEDTLLTLCEDMKLEITIGIKDSGRIGTGIHRARRFLEQATDYSIDTNHWHELDIIRKIRNHIVHNGSKFPSSTDKSNGETHSIIVTYEGKDYYVVYSDEKLIRYLEEHSIIHYYGTVFIYPTHEYCQYLVNFGNLFFGKIFHDLYLA